MPHVLVAGRLHPSGIALLEATPGVTFDYVEEVSESAYTALIGKADALILRTQPLTAATIEAANRLRVVSRHGVGYDAVNLQSLNGHGIALTIVGDVNSVSVAEQAMTLILALAKKTLRADQSVRGLDWSWRDRLEAGELLNRRLLIIGYGRIGQRLAQMAAGFAMDIRAYDPILEKHGWPAGRVTACGDLLEGLAWADIVSVHVPKTDGPLIGAVELAAMKAGAFLVNTARGGVIDETALAAALRAGRLGGAGLDVLSQEPPQPDNPLLLMDQVILSPHIAGLTAESAERMAIASVQNVLDYFAGCIDPALVVNWAELSGHLERASEKGGNGPADRQRDKTKIQGSSSTR